MSFQARVVGDLRPEAWLRRRLAHEAGLIAILLMETAWIVPWFRGLTPRLGAQSNAATSLLLLGLSVLAMLAGRFARRLELRAAVRTILLITALLLSTTLALRLILFEGAGLGTLEVLVHSVTSFAGVLDLLPDELLIILAVLYAWRRGVIAAERDPLDPARAAHAFRLGLLAFALHALIYQETHAALFFEALPVYALSGLMGIGLARADRLSASRGGGGTPFTARWLIALLGVGSVTVLLGLALSWLLLSPGGVGLAQWIGRAVQALAEGLMLAIGPLAIAVAAAVEAAVKFLIEVLGLESRFGGALNELPFPVLIEPEVDGGPPAWLVAYGPALRVLGTSLVVLLLALAAVRTGRRRPHGRPEPLEDFAESLKPGRRWPNSVRELLGGVLGSRRRPGARRVLAAETVRRLYSRLLRLAEARGQPRHPAKTPLEFLPSLERLYPDHAAEVRALTHAYIRVRYGEVPEENDEIAYLKACLASLKSAPSPGL
jgi:hypothetical protein